MVGGNDTQLRKKMDLDGLQELNNTFVERKFLRESREEMREYMTENFSVLPL